MVHQRFLQDRYTMCKLLVKKEKFDFNRYCIRAVNYLKEKLMSAPIIVALNWLLPFEFMYDINCLALDTVLGQRKEKIIT